MKFPSAESESAVSLSLLGKPVDCWLRLGVVGR